MSRYFALIASLPFLKFAELPSGFSSEKFLENASAFLSAKEMEALTSLTLLPAAAPERPVNSFRERSLIRRYLTWESALRNSLARIRAGKLGGAFADYARPEAGFEADAERVALSACNAANPLERERIVDEGRWEKIEELALFHMADFTALCAYRLKLQICEKWVCRTDAAKGAEQLSKAAEIVQEKEENAASEAMSRQD